MLAIATGGTQKINQHKCMHSTPQNQFLDVSILKILKLIYSETFSMIMKWETSPIDTALFR